MNDLAPLPGDLLVDSDATCSLAMERLGAVRRDRARIATTLAELVAAATKTAEDEATPLIAEEAALEARIAAWCSAERARLTGNNSTKTVGFSSGTVSWRLGKPKVQIDEALKEFIVVQLRKTRGFFDRFTVQTVAPSKAKMMAATEPEKAKLAKIRGVRFLPGEEAFSIVPAGAELAARPEAESPG